MSEWISSFGIAVVFIAIIVVFVFIYAAMGAIMIMTRYGWILFMVMVAIGMTVAVHNQLF